MKGERLGSAAIWAEAWATASQETDSLASSGEYS